MASEGVWAFDEEHFRGFSQGLAMRNFSLRTIAGADVNKRVIRSQKKIYSQTRAEVPARGSSLETSIQDFNQPAALLRRHRAACKASAGQDPSTQLRGRLLRRFLSEGPTENHVPGNVQNPWTP